MLGRNGSGKSTLLRILGGIYGYDSGTVRVSKRVAPVIELGAGFQPEFPALKNVIINAELMGIPERGGEAPLRLDHRVRGARGLHRPEAPQLLLRDEGAAGVLARDPGRCRSAAAGRGALGRRSGLSTKVRDGLRRATVRRERRRSSSSPSSRRRCSAICDRALLLEGGRIECIDDSATVARRYAEITLEGHGSDLAGPHTTHSVERARFVDLWLEDEDRRRAFAAFPRASGIRLHRLDRGLARRSRNRACSWRSATAPAPRSSLRRRCDSTPIRALPRGSGSRSRPESRTSSPRARTPPTARWSGSPTASSRRVSKVEAFEFVVVEGAVPTTGVIDLDHSLRVSSVTDGRDAAANGG